PASISGATMRPFLTAGAGLWLAERRASGRTTLSVSGDGGRTWASRLDYDGGLPTQVLVDAGGAGVVVAGQRDRGIADLVVFHTDDGGASWRRLAPPISAEAWGVPYFTDASRGWVLASLGPASAEVLATRDGGRTWSAAPPFNDRANFPGLSSVALRVLWTDDGRGVAVPPVGTGTTRPHVVVTDDGGITWRASFPAVPTGQDVTAADTMLDAGIGPDGRGTLFLRPAGARSGGVRALFAYATVDAGRTWARPVRVAGPAAGDAQVLFALDDQHWWAASGSGADLLASADGGRTTRRYGGLLPAGYAFQSIGFRTAGDGWAVATAGGRTAVMLTHDGGATWRAAGLPG
ncbi:MAG TPA: hypothetical protein VGO86_18320, partial [Candidatus Dormibacteraeota bacterium]